MSNSPHDKIKKGEPVINGFEIKRKFTIKIPLNRERIKAKIKRIIEQLQ